MLCMLEKALNGKALHENQRKIGKKYVLLSLNLVLLFIYFLSLVFVVRRN